MHCQVIILKAMVQLTRVVTIIDSR